MIDTRLRPRWQILAEVGYHRLRDSIDAHLTIVFAAQAVSRWIEDRTGRSIRRYVRTARRYRTIEGADYGAFGGLAFCR